MADLLSDKVTFQGHSLSDKVTCVDLTLVTNVFTCSLMRYEFLNK